ncbi:unnamed protein product [Leptosia nina]|uniref:Uncharacterized protein n=1 Tax=Leptosia nina TaxID=320188 RepID=A0AAV1J7Z0_9NEOP
MTAPRKHTILTLKDKLRVIDMLDKGDNYAKIVETFGIGRSTVSDIKRKKDKILKFMNLKERGDGVRKTLKTSGNPILEDALYTWLLQQRRLQVPITGQMICDKARTLHREITNSNIPFKASPGWLDKFKKRHGINSLRMVRRLSDDEATIEPFQIDLQKVITENPDILLTNCWTDVTTCLFNKSGKSMQPRPENSDDLENNVPLHQVFINLKRLNDSQISEIEFQEWDTSCAEKEISRCDVLSNEKSAQIPLCEDVEQDNDNRVETLASEKVSNSEAVRALNTALIWAEDNKFDMHEIIFLRQLRDRALRIKCEK